MILLPLKFKKVILRFQIFRNSNDYFKFRIFNGISGFEKKYFRLGKSTSGFKYHQTEKVKLYKSHHAKSRLFSR